MNGFAFEDLYFEPAKAAQTKSKLTEIDSSLSSFIERLSSSLEQMGSCWGSEQNDFLKYKKTIGACIDKYKELYRLNEEVSQLISEMDSYMTDISSAKIG